MKIIKCWSISVWDGGDRHNHRYYVESKELAQEWIARNKHDIIYEQEFLILEDLAEIEEHKTYQLRKSALAKLNAQEIKALGLIV